MATEEEAWDYLRREIDKEVKRSLPQSVYGTSGLTDVPEWYLWERLEKSGLRWELDVDKYEYLGSEQRQVRNASYSQTWYLVAVTGTLIVGGKPFPCVGGGEGRRIDSAYKGALTSLFKNGCKWAGLTMSVYKGAGTDDDYFDSDGGSPSGSSTSSRSASTSNSPAATPTATPVPTRKITTEEFLAKPINAVRSEILKEFNLALPRPNAGEWVEAAINLWLHASETGELSEEMEKPATGGTPINWVFHRLVGIHREQCRPDDDHVEEFHKKLVNASVPPEPPIDDPNS